MTANETSPLLRDNGDEHTETRTYANPDNDVPDHGPEEEGFAATKPPAIRMASIVSSYLEPP